nr:hypothetical protein [Streptomyces sp. TLI_235]
MWSPPGSPHRHSGSKRQERSCLEAVGLLAVTVLGLLALAFVALFVLVATSDIPLVQF